MFLQPYEVGDRVQMASSLPEETPSTLDGRTGTVTEPPFEESDGEVRVGVHWDHPMSDTDDEEDYEFSEFLQYEGFFQ